MLLVPLSVMLSLHVKNKYIFRERSRMQINTISLVIYAALIVLSAYNLRLAWRLSKLQTSALLRRPEDILPDESARLQAINQDKKKWNILGRVFFWVALLVAFVGEMEELAFFLSLYSICNIIVLRGNIATLNILAAK